MSIGATFATLSSFLILEFLNPNLEEMAAPNLDKEWLWENSTPGLVVWGILTVVLIAEVCHPGDLQAETVNRNVGYELLHM